ncbi:hypothetical protein [Nocardiopsis tropica]|uniref:Uncharacterized protein n=1 Tax=Nocardiopsis tropica TaxID=109330 RepID=A0ABU7KK83_9ACTN|nr:hypothetical protein [Nocardiopsis umidischolae]MEE2049704.1 hypothetical protein [Nocardiopsis umidischolae]
MNPSDFADAVADQWHELYGTSRLEVPMSVLATLVLRQHLVIPAEENTDTAGFMSGQQRTWEAAAQWWPYLHHRWECFTDWPTWPDHHRTTQAATVFALRLRTLGVIDHLRTLTHGQDFLGAVLHRLNAPVANTAPNPMRAGALCPAYLQQDMPVQTITLDQVGTGHRILGVVTMLRTRGIDPARVTWHLREIGELAAAVLCVNLATWRVADPGRANVLVSTSEDDDWIQAERELRAETLRALLDPPFGL